MTKLHEGFSEKPVLPLVLVTVGSADGEIEAVHRHLESVAQESEPQFQSLIVARPDIPKMFYKVLRERIRSLPNVYVLRLGANKDECCEHLHETGTFLAIRKEQNKED